MKATDFEVRYQTLLHLLLIAVAALTYSVDRDDIVWALVRHHADSALFERVAFSIGAFLAFNSALLATFRIISRPHLSRLLFALALGLLLPRSGTAILISGEAFLVFRLSARDQAKPGPPRTGGFRWALSRWSIAASLIVLTLTLQDSWAEAVAGIGVLLWLGLNRDNVIGPQNAI